ncbi:MAG: nucleotide-binding protein [Ignavibacteriae bacterium]|nr:nucleotide-binding protein [Ignavibacteriota bacterium]
MEKVFIGSSKQSIHISDAVLENLKYENIEPVPWYIGEFTGGFISNLESLITTLNKVKYAIFILTNEQNHDAMGAEYYSLRDNIIFELGFFISKLGKDNVFMIKPDNMHINLPSDLKGYDPYNFPHQYSNIAVAIRTEINTILKKIGIR